jgi:acetyltransferase-like isoleucine patch superfamily enzyme
VCSLLTRLRLRAWGCPAGSGLRCIGHPGIRRAAGSTLALGARCRLRSTFWSNQIGVNRPCGLSTLRRGAVLRIGDDCGFSGTIVAAAQRIEIGNRVRCGANTTITDTDWHTDDPRSGGTAPVVIEDDVWLGLNVVVLKGVRIGRNSVVAAGSVVTRDIPANVVAGGVPARVLKPLPEDVVARLARPEVARS